jgi:hypothetical protein
MLMGRSLLWIIALSLPIIFLGLLAYLLKDSVLSFNWPQLKTGDLINLGALAIGFFGAFVAIGSLFVAVSQLQQAVRDGEEQRKSLDASREQLQAVVEAVKSQQEVLAKNLETSKAVLTLQKEQQTVLAKSLEISTALLALQEQQWKREQERANRKPKLAFLIGDKEASNGSIETSIHVGQDNRAILITILKNVGSDLLRRPMRVATASKEDISIRFDHVQIDSSHPYSTQYGGGEVYDILPFSTSENTYSSKIHFIIPPNISGFDLTYIVTGDNLDAPFQVLIHIQVDRS